MTLNRSMLVWSGLAALSVLAGCDNKIKDENALLLKENDALRTQLAQRNEALSAADKERLAADARATDAEQRLKDYESAPPPLPAANIGDTFIDENITVTETPEGLNMSIPGDVLFDSGKATLKPEARKTLANMVAEVKSKYSDRSLRVSGFTDTDPIKKSSFKSNYHLAFDRAYAVREYLTENGIDGADVSLASYGPQDPKATKAASRRVEILVLR